MYESDQVVKIVQACTDLWYSPPVHTDEEDLWWLIKKVTREWLEMQDTVHRAQTEITVFNHIKETSYWKEG